MPRSGRGIDKSKSFSLKIIQRVNSTIRTHHDLPSIKGATKPLHYQQKFDVIFVFCQYIAEGWQPAYIYLSGTHCLNHRRITGRYRGFKVKSRFLF